MTSEARRDVSTQPVVRDARAPDVPAINDIYNHYVRMTAVTFDIEEISRAAREAWFERFAEDPRHRCLVAERDGRVVGWACTHQFRVKAAYDTSVETTVYCAPDATGQGLGRRLYGALFEVVANEDIHRFYAGVTLPNDASLALHRAFGYTPLALYSEVGRKFGRYWDVQWFERPGPR